MANYYYITIESDKMTQDVANEILQTIAPKQMIRYFNFHEGYLSYNTRGLENITDILETYGFNDGEDKIEVKDEFDYAYDNMTTPEESTKGKIKDIVNEIEMLMTRGFKMSDEMIEIKNALSNIVEGN